MASSREKGARYERKAIDLYRGLGFKTFNPLETRFAPKLPFGDFIFYSPYEIGFCESKFHAPHSYAELKRHILDSRLPVGAVLIDLVVFDGRGGYRIFQFNGDDWVEYKDIMELYKDAGH